MQYLLMGAIAFGIALTTNAQASTEFKRPDCSAYQDWPKPEQKCIRVAKNEYYWANKRAVQSAGLEFVHMGRPDSEGKKAVEKVLEDKVEGEFSIRYSVGVDGKVYGLKVVETAPEALAPLATLWAETIQNWSFAPMEKPALDVEFRRIYLYAPEEEEQGKDRVKE